MTKLAMSIVWVGLLPASFDREQPEVTRNVRAFGSKPTLHKQVYK
jgi:hypothetical protein